MTQRVAIVGAYTTPCRPHWFSKSLWELFQMAMSGALADAKLDLSRIDGGVVGIYNDIFCRQAIPECSLIGQMAPFVPFTRVTNGGATGIYAFATAYDMVKCGRKKIVACVGGEKATDCFDFLSMTQTPEVVQTIAWSWDWAYERDQGATAADSYAEVILSYLDRYPNDLRMDVRTEILRIMCEAASRNPNAQRRGEVVTPEMVEASPWIIEPAFKKLETCVYTEGACADPRRRRRGRGNLQRHGRSPDLGRRRRPFHGAILLGQRSSVQAAGPDRVRLPVSERSL